MSLDLLGYARTIAGARHVSQLDSATSSAWSAASAGRITLDAASVLDTLGIAIRERLANGDQITARSTTGGTFGPTVSRRSRARAPGRFADRVRRRRNLAMEAWAPAAILAQFTLGEAAVLATVGRLCARAGFCDKSLKELGDLSGVCRSVASSALAKARALGLTDRRERRFAGRKSRTNIITILDEQWSRWLRRRAERRAAAGEQHPSSFASPIQNKDIYQSKKGRLRTVPSDNKGIGLGRGRSSARFCATAAI